MLHFFKPTKPIDKYILFCRLKENERTWKKVRMMRNMCMSDMGMCRCCSGKFTKIKAVSFRMCTKNC